ncbi:MAG: hypothetical protein M1552_03315 [Firmicutes bacterium]|nr:hypothetical protein [Bacillota bacterium]MCL5993190.1 hypothetical protein [Bacillota bacterium]
MQLILSKLKNKKLLFLLVLLVAALFFWSESRQAPDTAEPPAPGEPPGATALQPPANDAAIYQALEAYLAGLVADDQEAVLALLTESHRQEFTEASFLLQPGTIENYSEIVLAELDHSFPTYTSQFPGLEGVPVAVLVTEYTVNFYQNGTLAASPRFREELLFRQEGQNWLIAGSQRDFVGMAEQAP